MAISITAINQRDYGDAYCLATCYLAIAKSFGYSITMEKLKTEGIVASNGYVNSWGAYVARGDSKTYKVANIKADIDSGKPCIIYGQSSYGDHYVVAYDYSGNTIKVMDPWGGTKGNIGDCTLKSTSSYRACTKGTK